MVSGRLSAEGGSAVPGGLCHSLQRVVGPTCLPTLIKFGDGTGPVSLGCIS